MKRIAALVLLAVAAAACAGEPEEQTPIGQGSPIAVENAYEFGLPDEFPLPQGATEANLVTSGTDSINIRFIVDRTPDEMQTYYSNELRKDGWSVLGVESAGELLTTVSFIGHGWSGTVSIVREDKPIQVVVTMRPEVIGPAPSDG